MYVDDKQLKFEIKEVHSSIHELANDLGGDIRFLHQEISELRETVEMLQQDIRQIKEQINGS
jgi:polyhydroxyalkanoate synthesis regulator phasin